MPTNAISQRIVFPRKLAGVRRVDPIRQAARQAAPAQTPKPPRNAPPPYAKLEALLTKIDTQAASIIQDDQRRLLELQQAAIELALAAADCLASRCVELGKYSVQGMITQAIEMSGESGSLVVAINPADHELFKALPEEEVAAFTNISIQTDPKVSRGECRIQTSSERLSFDIGNRMESIRRAWMETLDDAAA